MHLPTLTAPLPHTGRQDVLRPDALQDQPFVTLPKALLGQATDALRALFADGAARLHKGRAVAERMPQGVYTWEGQAKRGERFGVHMWEDTTLLLWRRERGHLYTLYPSPLQLRERWSVQDEAYTLTMDTGQAPVMARQVRSYTKPDVEIGNPFDGAPLTRHLQGEKGNRALAITRATLLQELSDLADTIPHQPTLCMPEEAPRPGKDRMILPVLAVEAVGDGAPRDALLDTLLTPLLARAVVDTTLQGKAVCKVEAGLMAPNGALRAPPRLTITITDTRHPHTPAGHRVWMSQAPLTPAQNRLAGALQQAFDTAWVQQRLGNPYAWLHARPDNQAIVATCIFDSATLSAHRLLAMLATPTQKARGKSARSLYATHPSS